jgi:hypothetical protein
LPEPTEDSVEEVDVLARRARPELSVSANDFQAKDVRRGGTVPVAGGSDASRGEQTAQGHIQIER